jgi:hypothetical protein
MPEVGEVEDVLRAALRLIVAEPWAGAADVAVAS